MISKIINFIKIDIWRIRLKNVHPAKSFFIKLLRIVLLSVRGFDENKCQLRASALTYYSLLSIVPVVAMAFGIAKGFGFDKMLKNQLLQKFPGQEEIFAQVIGFAQSMLENTKGGVVAGIGVAILFWTVIKVLGNIETSFNDIWGIKQARAISRKFSDYLSIMLICPILVIASSGITVFISTQIILITEKVTLLGAISPLIFFVLKILPYCVIWLLFSFIYIFMPNSKVNFSSGIVAGIISGSIYQFLQWAYINFQIGASKYNAIYGSFAALPLFLVWLQLSWLVVFFGAEISFAHQNVDTYEFEPDCLLASRAFRRLLALRITHYLVKKFAKGQQPGTATEISHTLEIPIRLVRDIIFELTESGILIETKTKDPRVLGFQPARGIDILSIKYIINAMEHRGTEDAPVLQDEELAEISESLKSFSDSVEKSPKNKLLKDI